LPEHIAKQKRAAGLAGLAASLLAALPAAAQEAPQPASPPAEPAAPAPAPPAAPAPPGQQDHEPYKPTAEIDLARLETADLRLLYFDPAQTYLTPYIARSFLNSLAFQKRMFEWTPWEKTTVLLKDFSDYGNAGARSSPNNAILIDVAPLSQTFETFSAGERFFTLMNHEAVHVANMDVWNGTDAKWRRLFGGKPMPIQEHPETILYNFLTTPRVNVPRWYLEGAAVFMETWMAGGFGRGQGGYDEMVFRAMVRDDARFFSPLGLESEGTAIDFQVGVNDYLYGTRFFSYLALTRSPQKVLEWLKRGEGSKGYYSAQFKHVFGEPLDTVWDQWMQWEKGFQRENLANVGKYPLTPVERLSPRALGSVSRLYQDRDGNFVGAFRYPGVIGHVGVLSPADGKVRHLQDVKGAMLYRVTSLAYDADTGTAFYTSDNYSFRNLIAIDTKTGKSRTLIKQGRIGDIVLNPATKELWGLRHLNGFVTLVRIDPPYTGWTQVYTFPYGRIPYDLDISPDGTLMSASIGEVNGDQAVKVFRIGDFATGDPQPIAELKLGSAAPESFVFTPDGKALYGSAYYTGVSNIYRLDIQSGKVDAVSNSSTGLFRPIPQADGSLIALEFTGQGFTPVRFAPQPLESLGNISFLGARIAETHPVVKEWTVGTPARVDLEAEKPDLGRYIPSQQMRLGAIFPIVQGYLGDVAGGFHMVFEDPMQFNQISATVGYSPGTDAASERLHLNLQARTVSWNFQYWHNLASFYDLFGPTQTARKGDALIVGYRKALIYSPPEQLNFTAELGGYFGLDTLPASQNIAASDADIGSLSLALDYTNTSKSLGAVDHEKGLMWDLAFEPDYAGGEAYPKARAGLGFGVPIGWNHSSLWLYSAAGVAGGDRSNVLSAYYFGGFGNNIVDDGAVERYRDHDSFPGYEINGIAARSFARSMAEWNLPPLRFAEAGIPSLYLSHVRGALFAGALATRPPGGGEQVLGTAGAQLNFNFTLALRLPMTFSVGYAKGFRISDPIRLLDGSALPTGRHRNGEFMLSLKVL
jgi:hypothetical protein